jgi:hypothetical protein
MTHLKLDKFLQYVHIPNLRATWDGYRADVRNAVEAWRCPGRVDFCMIFDWLKRRGAEKILKIIVDDVGDDRGGAHSDQAIEYSVRDLGVEIWDWRKKDISSEVIYNTARDTVREVSLYCSGSNAVLRGWADTGGLVKLPKVSVTPKGRARILLTSRSKAGEGQSLRRSGICFHNSGRGERN